VSPVEIGTRVVNAGYGFESVDAGTASNMGRLKVGTAKTIGATALNTFPETAAVCTFAEGLALNPQAGSTATADGGGALYRDGTQQVVGVDSGGYYGTIGNSNADVYY